ncbi:hypothetical protein [Microbulbifer epialgicus]|uniref:Toxin co-regulated pilus biosynthesis protein Q n=1 Tax=Microbulbifer epialgicus TaxID=393907 RepID=A0ABV4NU50_9GAMM
MIRKKSISKFLLMLSASVIMSACTTLDVIQRKAVRLDGTVYYYNESGELELTSEQLEELEKNGAVVRIKHVAPSGALILDPEEMAVLMQDRSLFFAELDGKKAAGKVSTLIKKGSLRKSIERIANSEGWEKVEWNLTVDYYVEKPFAVVGPDFQSVIVEAVQGYPIYVAFDESDEKNRTIKVMEKQAELETP